MLNCLDMKNNFNIFAETIVQLFKIQTMSAFYVTTKEGKRLYVKTFDKSKGEIEWTENKRGQLYRREDTFYSQSDLEFMKFHFKDKYPYMDTMQRDTDFYD